MERNVEGELEEESGSELALEERVWGVFDTHLDHWEGGEG
jgi:hypothetical protein